MRKPAIYICEADQRLCFRFSESTIPLLHFKLVAVFCGCTAHFVSYLFKNHIVGFPMRRLKFTQSMKQSFRNKNWALTLENPTFDQGSLKLAVHLLQVPQLALNFTRSILLSMQQNKLGAPRLCNPTVQSDQHLIRMPMPNAFSLCGSLLSLSGSAFHQEEFLEKLYLV